MLKWYRNYLWSKQHQARKCRNLQVQTHFIVQDYICLRCIRYQQYLFYIRLSKNCRFLGSLSCLEWNPFPHQNMYHVFCLSRLLASCFGRHGHPDPRSGWETQKTWCIRYLVMQKRNPLASTSSFSRLGHHDKTCIRFLWIQEKNLISVLCHKSPSRWSQVACV